MKSKYIAGFIILTAIIFLEVVLFNKLFTANDSLTTKTENQKIAEFYQNEVSTLVSPHHVRKAMASGQYDFVLVDVRSPEEYNTEHITTAVNIAAYADKENTQKSDSQRIVEEFKKLKSENGDRDIVIYCYSYACMTGKKIGKLLSDNGIYAKELGVGWNEWKYFWKQWNYPHEWKDINPDDYITKGKNPGTMKADPNLITGCSLDNELGC